MRYILLCSLGAALVISGAFCLCAFGAFLFMKCVGIAMLIFGVFAVLGTMFWIIMDMLESIADGINSNSITTEEYMEDDEGEEYEWRYYDWDAKEDDW